MSDPVDAVMLLIKERKRALAERDEARALIEKITESVLADHLIPGGKDGLFHTVNWICFALRDEKKKLAAVTAERDALKNMPPLMSPSAACRVHHIQCCHACDRADCGDNQTPSIVALRAERDALAAELAALKDSDSTLSISPMIAVTSSTGQPELFEYDRMRLELAALRRRLADAERVEAFGYVEDSAGKFFLPASKVGKYGRYALVRLEDGE